jgi:TRAP-type C4-dicarboxylate transport system permease small subunit
MNPSFPAEAMDVNSRSASADVPLEVGTSAADPPVADHPLAEDYLAAFALALLFLITFSNALVRYFSNLSFAWTEEISLFLMVLMTLFGAAAAAARDRHLRVEFFLSRGSISRRRFLAMFGALVTAAFFVAFAWLAFEMVREDWRYEETSPGLGLPRWVYTAWMPVLFLVIAGRAYSVFRRSARRQ